MAEQLKGKDEIREAVRERYAPAANAASEGRSGELRPALALAAAEAADPIGVEQRMCEDLRRRALFAVGERASCPTPPSSPRSGCGNPTAVAELHEGETVLDLGSGGGIDVLLSARRVGPTGKAYGLDMTDEMLELARANQREARVENVEFLKGTIEEVPAARRLRGRDHLQLRDQPLRRQGPLCSREAARVLRPGGRFAVTDIVADPEMDDATRARHGAVDRMHRRRAHRGRVPGRARGGRLRGRRDPRDPPRPRARRLGDHPGAESAA